MANGNLDWIEWLLAGMEAATNGLRFDPFNSDTDGNGELDGYQLDADDDGVVNAMDADQANGAIGISSGPRWRYAVFPLPPHAYESNPDNPPQMINAQGKVLYWDSVWQNGSHSALEVANQNHINQCIALSMNDDGAILGQGMAQRPPTNPSPEWEVVGGYIPSPTVLAWWDDQDSDPIPVEAQGHFARPVELTPVVGLHGERTFPWDAVLSPGKQFLGIRSPPVKGNQIRSMWRRTQEGFAFVDDPALNQEGYIPRFVAGPSDAQGVNPRFVWGDVPDGTRLLHSGKVEQFAGSVLRVGMMPMAPEQPGYPVAFTLAGTPMSKRTEAWAPEATFTENRDISENGVRLKHPWILVQDKREDFFSAWAPDVAATLEAPRFVNASRNGWILMEPRSDSGAAVAMPMLLEDNVESTGVDSFSLSGTAMAGVSGTQAKSWIMVPKGGNPNGFKLRSLAGDGNVLTLEAPGLEFGNGNSQVVVQQPLTSLTLKAAKMELASGTEIDIGIKLGATASVSSPLAAKVMAHRVAKVGVFRVHRLRKDDVPDEPDMFPDEAELSAYLNSIFEPQINLKLELEFVPTPIIADLNQGDDNDPTMATGSMDENSLEQGAILKDADGMKGIGPFHIRIFIVASPGPIGSDRYGSANRAGNTCWIWGTKELQNVDAGFQNHTIAHEIGHIVTDYGHPNDIHGKTRVPGSDFKKRLMAGGAIRGARGTLLVKGEWDQAEERMRIIIDPPPTP
jgi:hypothetical protein